MHCFMNMYCLDHGFCSDPTINLCLLGILCVVIFSNNLSNPIKFLLERTSLVSVGGFHVEYHNYIYFFSTSLGRNAHAYAMIWPMLFYVDVPDIVSTLLLPLGKVVYEVA